MNSRPSSALPRLGDERPCERMCNGIAILVGFGLRPVFRQWKCDRCGHRWEERP